MNIQGGTDEVGNLYEREEQSDRIYGAGGRLERSAIKKGQGIQYQSGRPMDNDIPDGTHYFYDPEGNLTGKVESSGDTWFYTYYGNRMLKKVVKPDRSEVSFLYDPFGRRIEKEASGEGSKKGTEPPKSLIIWVFQDDFIPRAKVTEDGSYSIISDYPGTPAEAYDEEGRKVWERELDLYGRVKRSRKDRFGSTTELVGEDGFIPFRYQGQCEDE